MFSKYYKFHIMRFTMPKIINSSVQHYSDTKEPEIE